MEELTAAIQAWMQDGDHVVLGLDVNEDVRYGAVQKELANIGMFEAIIRHHPTKSVPATCNTNESRKPIDGIWTSPGMEVLRCGYLPFDSYNGFSSDQRMVWAEIDNASIKLAHTAYKKTKKDASEWRTGFQETFVTAKAKERCLSEEVVIKQMKREKESKEKGLNSRIIRGRNNKAPIVRAIDT